MLYKLQTGRMDLGKELTAEVRFENIIGEIEKVIISFGKDTNPDFHVQIITSDGEVCLDINDNKDSVYYPRNWNVASQKYTGTHSMPAESSVLDADKWIIFGWLKVAVQGPGAQDYIKNIEIIMNGEKKEETYLQKEDAMVSTATLGVSNPIYSRRKKGVSEALRKTYGDTARELGSDFIVKDEGKLESMSEFISRSIYERKFDNVSKSISEIIKEYIVNAIKKGKSPQDIARFVMRKGSLSSSEAMVIARTEYQAIHNKMREWSYRQLDPEGELKYKWIGPSDYRTTEICKRIKERTEKGVELSKLNEIVKQEGKKGGFEPRDFNPHINCRHTFVKVV